MATAIDFERQFRSHGLVKQIQAIDSQAVITRSVHQVRKEEQEHNFTVGTLVKTQAFTYPPWVIASRASNMVVAAYRVGLPLQGFPGVVHGSVFSIIADECCGRSLLCYFDKHADASAAVTTHFEVKYLKPIPTNSTVVVHAVVDEEKSTPRKAVSKASIYVLKEQKQVLVGTVCGTYINPYAGRSKL